MSALSPVLSAIFSWLVDVVGIVLHGLLCSTTNKTLPHTIYLSFSYFPSSFFKVLLLLGFLFFSAAIPCGPVFWMPDRC